MIVHLILGAWFLFVAALLTGKTRQEVCYRCYARNIIGRCWQVGVSTPLIFSGFLLHYFSPVAILLFRKDIEGHNHKGKCVGMMHDFVNVHIYNCANIRWSVQVTRMWYRSSFTPHHTWLSPLQSEWYFTYFSLCFQCIITAYFLHLVWLILPIVLILPLAVLTGLTIMCKVIPDCIKPSELGKFII